VHKDLLPLLDGKTFRYGVVSDTHLSSNEEALPELHAAYDWFAREGVETVLHAGDWTTGRGVFRGQDSEIKVHSITDQARRLVTDYPKRDGIQTIGIAGNHDLEGKAADVGFDPVYHLAAERSDITYLGGMSAWLEVGAETLGENAPYIHLLHGKGGMSYSFSYKAQKLVDGYPAGRKPAVLIPGHWHVKGNIRARNVEVLWPACFEWQSPFMARLGLHPAVGFHLVEMTVGPDGSVVGFMPRFFAFYEGRVVG
jgi:predicted phosphodiesterase